MWNIIQCAVQGIGHKKTNIPCQDKTYSLLREDMQVIALADGAGSASMSEYGAEEATKYICSTMLENFDDYFSNEDGAMVKQKIISGLSDELEKKSKELNCEIRELASTLLFVAVKNNRFILSHIGDGVIGYLKDDELKIASYPENGEFTNETIFTTSKNAIGNMKLIKGDLNSIIGFVLMSDGAETSLYHKKDKVLSSGVKKIMKMSTLIDTAILENQLRKTFENVVIKATSDDCSIIIMTKSNDKFNGYRNLSKSGKCRILEISNRTSRKTINRYDEILEYLVEKKSISQIANRINLKPKYTKKYINKLRKLNFVEKDGFLYHTILTMEE